MVPHYFSGEDREARKMKTCNSLTRTFYPSSLLASRLGAQKAESVGVHRLGVTRCILLLLVGVRNCSFDRNLPFRILSCK